MHSRWTIGRQAGLRRDTDFMAGKTAVLARKGPRAGRWQVVEREGWEPFVLRRAWSRPQQGEGARARKGKKVGGRTHELKGVRASSSNPLRLGASAERAPRSGRLLRSAFSQGPKEIQFNIQARRGRGLGTRVLPRSRALNAPYGVPPREHSRGTQTTHSTPSRDDGVEHR